MALTQPPFQILCYSVFLTTVSSLSLDGSTDSFIEFGPWHVGDNGSLRMEFRTEQGSALLLYTDDRASGDFFELKLVAGILRLSYNLGSGSQMMSVGRRLADNQWHRVVITRKQVMTSLSVDESRTTSMAPTGSSEFYFGSSRAYVASHSEDQESERLGSVFVGGLPTPVRISSLALPSAAFEPKFSGQVRNIVFSSVDGMEKRQEVIKSSGVRWNNLDACSDNDPCQNGATCVSTDTGPACQCQSSHHHGNHCQFVDVAEVSLGGSDYLSWSSAAKGGHGIATPSDTVTFSFRTKQPDSPLLQIVGDDSLLTIELKKSGLDMRFQLNNDEVSTQIRPGDTVFNDNEWHEISLKRTVKQVIGSGHSVCHVSLEIDKRYKEEESVYGSQMHLTTREIHIGSAPQLSKKLIEQSKDSHQQNSVSRSLYSPKNLPMETNHSNFIGCMKGLEYKTDSLRLNLIELAHTGSNLMLVTGNPVYRCLENASPEQATDYRMNEMRTSGAVSFETSEAHLILPTWISSKSGSISFRFRTNQPDGLILFNKGGNNMSDIFAVELVSGELWCHFDLGSGPVRVNPSGAAAGFSRRLDDSRWHLVSVTREGRQGHVSVDGVNVEFVTPGSNERLDLEGALYVAGLGGDFDLVTIPPQVWSGSLRRGFVGCLQDMLANGIKVDLEKYAARQQIDTKGAISDCSSRLGSCGFSPCQNGGLCMEGWHGTVCDCTYTSFTGLHCHQDAVTLSFNGTQHMILPLRHETYTEADDITLRFRSYSTSGLLFATTSGNSDRLELALVKGRIRFAIRIDEIYKSVMAGENLDDGKWHRLHVQRRGRHLQLYVDDKKPQEGNLEPKSMVLRVRFVYIGAKSLGSDGDWFGAENFHGQLQHLRLNGRDVLQLLNQNTFRPQQESTGRFLNPTSQNHRLSPTSNKTTPKSNSSAVTFKSHFTYLSVPHRPISGSLDISFRFRTTETSGLLLYGQGDDGDFLALELALGRINYVFDLGDGPIRVGDTGSRSLNDGMWHSVALQRKDGRTHLLTVDRNEAAVTSVTADQHLNLGSLVYIGGVPVELYPTLPRDVQSQHGFQGCLEQMILEGTPVNLISDASTIGKDVSPGCAGERSGCHPGSCNNLGICIQQQNSVHCDCSLTSFTGSICDQDSLSYQFGQEGGRIDYIFDKEDQADRRSDEIALGFVTDSSHATLLRLDSDTHRDFLEIKLIESNVYMIYDVGSHVISVSDLQARVDDGRYHTIRVTRNGANSTLQLDNRPVQYKYPRVIGSSSRKRRSSGHQQNVFHGASRVTIGNSGQKTQINSEVPGRSFHGIISGVVLNGRRVLDEVALASTQSSTSNHQNSKISIHGVTEVQALPITIKKEYEDRQWSSIDSVSSVVEDEEEIDDLITSHESSGCEDPADYMGCKDTGQIDDELVTAVYMNVYEDDHQSAIDQDCDDEDCESGSGHFQPIDPFANNPFHTEPPIYELTESTLNQETTDFIGRVWTTHSTSPSGIDLIGGAWTTHSPPAAGIDFIGGAWTTQNMLNKDSANEYDDYTKTMVDTTTSTTTTTTRATSTTHRSWGEWWEVSSTTSTTTERYIDPWLNFPEPEWHTKRPIGVTPPWLVKSTPSTQFPLDHNQIRDSVWPTDHFPAPPIDGNRPGGASSSTQRSLVALTDTFHEDPDEYAAMIVGIVAAVLIVVVLILLVVLKLQGRSGATGSATFRTSDNGKVLVAGRLTAASPPLLSDVGQEQQSSSPPNVTGNGAVLHNTNTAKAKKRRDIKEWYV